VNDWACIFDWDGVVVNSERMHVLAWHEVAATERRPRPDIPNLGCCGLKSEAVIRDLLRWTDDPDEVRRLDLYKEETFRRMVARQGIDSQPGVVAFVRALKAARVPCAVGSSAPRPNIVCGAEALGIRDVFPVIVSAEDVHRGKPAPDIFLLAAKRLGVPPGRCLVFEDAPAGVAAAKPAGMRAVGVLTTHPAEPMRGADRLIRNFEGLQIDELRLWMG